MHTLAVRRQPLRWLVPIFRLVGALAVRLSALAVNVLHVVAAGQHPARLPNQGFR